MVKRVIWIDDDESAMKAVIQNIFPQLWDKEISSEIYILGDYAPSELNYEHDENSINNVNQAIYQTFINYLINSKLINQEDDVRKKLYLLGLENIVNDFHKEVRVASNKDYLICQTAGSIHDIANKTANGIINAMKSDDEGHNSDETVIMLDLVLLKHDYEALRKHYESHEKVVTVLSMELYKELIDLLSNSPIQPSVMLYSTFVIPTDVINNWIKGYSDIGGEPSDLIIYNREGKPANKDNEKELVEKIASLEVKK